MAITKTPDQAAFDALDALLVADTAASNGLANVTQVANAYSSNAVLLGNYDSAATPTFRLIRRGDPKKTTAFPRVECDVVTTNRRDTQGKARAESFVRLHYFTKRDVPNGFGSQNNVVLRARSVFSRVTPTTTGGWLFAPLHEPRGFQGPADDTTQHFIEEYAVTMAAAAGDF